MHPPYVAHSVAGHVKVGDPARVITFSRAFTRRIRRAPSSRRIKKLANNDNNGNNSDR